MDRSSRRGDRRGRQWPRQLLDSSDEQLVRFVLAGDEEAFELLFDRHVADAFWFARETLGSEAEAEEAVGHSFAAARAYLGARDRGVEFGPWLQTILGNHCLSMIQARGPLPRRSGKVVDLAEWRRQRGRLGFALPFAPLAGMREGLVALCGIGGGGAAATGAAGGGASLVTGTLAKVAVAALLAGGVGAAGKAVVEREPPARAAVVADGGSSKDIRDGPGSLRLAPAAPAVSLERGARELRRARVEARERAERSRPEPEPVASVPDTPVAVAPPELAVARSVPLPATPGASVPPHHAPVVPEAGKAVLEEVERTATEVLPVLGLESPPPSEVEPPLGLDQLPAPVVEVVEDLPAIGDDPPVIPETLSEDLRGLLPPEPPPQAP